MPANLENSAVGTGLEKVSFHASPKESNAKERWNYRTIALISHTCKAMHLQSNTESSPSQALLVHEPWTSLCSSWI